MDKHHILDRIRSTAHTNGGVPLGSRRFFKETGIRHADWFGKYWARWGDALREAGFAPNTLQGGYDEDELLRRLVLFIRELGHFPVSGELRLKHRTDPEFPDRKTYEVRFGLKRQFMNRVLEYCVAHPTCGDVAEICRRGLSKYPVTEPAEQEGPVEIVGFVYLAKSGRYFKIGKTNSAGRRHYELGLQLPERATLVHVIETDDPSGIEAYWHKRFAPKWKNGEWFELEATDVVAFKRRKFM